VRAGVSQYLLGSLVVRWKVKLGPRPPFGRFVSIIYDAPVRRCAGMSATMIWRLTGSKV
jgi:hypothetical protein